MTRESNRQIDIDRLFGQIEEHRIHIPHTHTIVYYHPTDSIDNRSPGLNTLEP